MAKIFISYRRSDSQHAVDRLQQEMRPYVKNARRDIFVDVDNIPIGRDFEEHLQGKVSECDALLAVIGPDWLTSSKDDGTRRIDDPEDFVRTEIAAALSRNIPVVPVLLDGAQVPHASQLPENLKPLAKRNGAQLDRKSFAADVDHIMTGLGLTKSGGGAGKWLAGLVAVAALAVGGWYGWQVYGDALFAPEGEPEVTEIADAGDTAPAEPEDAESEEDAEYRAELITRYQAALGALEYYDGIVDGEVSDAIHDASKAFTADHGRTNLGLDFANLDALERLVIYAEDTLETKELNEELLEKQKRDAEAQLERDLEDQRREAEAEIERERQAALDKARRDAKAEADRLAALEATKPDWAKGLTGEAKRFADKCLDGSMGDCNNLGAAYRGIHPSIKLPQNNAHARRLYAKACDSGTMEGCYNLGNLYQHGRGVSVDYGRARTLYAKACDGGNMKGCSNLGNLYHKGSGVSVDYGRARTLYSKACDGGEMQGCHNLGTLYYEGSGVPVDKVRAKQLHQKACDSGIQNSCDVVRKFY